MPMNVLSTMLGGALDIAKLAINHKHDREMMQKQHELNELSANKQMQRNLDIYNQTQSTGAKVNELNDAGLSVGMLQGTPSQGGAGSTSAASTGLANTPMDLSAMMKLATLPAEIARIKAETKNLEEEAKTKSIDNANRDEMWEKDFALKDEQIQSLRTTTRGQEIINKVQEATAEDQIRKAKAEAGLTEKQNEQIEASIWKMKEDVKIEILKIKTSEKIANKEMALQKYIADKARELQKELKSMDINIAEKDLELKGKGVENQKEMVDTMKLHVWVSAGASVLNNVLTTVADFIPNPNRIIKNAFNSVFNKKSDNSWDTDM